MIVRMSLIGVCLLFAVGCQRDAVGPNDADAVESTPVQVFETWDVIYLAGTKVGYVHTTWQFDKENDEVRIGSVQKLDLKRGADTSSVEQITTSTETGNGRLREFELTTKAGGDPSVVEGRVREGKLKITSHSQGRTQTSELPWSENQGGLFETQRDFKANPMKPNETRTQQVLIPGVDSVIMVEQKLKSFDVEQTRLIDTEKALLKIRASVKIGETPIDVVLWCDEQGDVWKQEIPATRQTIIRATKAIALKASDQQLDIANASVVKVARAIQQPHRTKQAVYRITLEQSDPATLFASGLSQTVKKTGPKSADITVRAISANQPAAPLPIADEPATAADREPNQHIQSADAEVVALSKQVAVDEADQWKVAIALERHVKSLMKQTDYSTAFESAAAVAKNRTGDCTEHAVLLAALCRARGIPARVVTGLVYSSGVNGFAYHMWTEVWLNDRWIPLDATLGQGGIGAAHLKLAHSHLAGSSEFDAFLPVSQVLWQLKIEVIAID